jgi:DNA-binding response OmpR family regulator
MPADHPTLASKGALLLVDDEPSIAKYMGLVLGREGFQVLTAFSAEDGWELFQREAPQVRAVVTDLSMPGDWNGLELARRVREASPNTPVLLVTGFEPSGPLDACSGVLPKPFRADVLRTAVRQMIEQAVGCVR